MPRRYSYRSDIKAAACSAHHPESVHTERESARESERERERARESERERERARESERERARERERERERKKVYYLGRERDRKVSQSLHRGQLGKQLFFLFLWPG